MAGIIERAKSGRAHCKACEQLIGKDTLRVGEQSPNPFGEGLATYWFHPSCAAYKRPACLLEAQAVPSESDTELSTELNELVPIAREGAEHQRLNRIRDLERARSARARCRSCKETIAHNSWRVVLDIWEEGRFQPI